MAIIAKSLLNKEESLGIVGLGYVGLPIVLAFAKKGVPVVAFDVSQEKVANLRQGIDITKETSCEELLEAAASVSYTSNAAELKKCALIIVAVPTPIDSHRTPDLSPLEDASRLIGENLKKGAIVVYESTVYPGVTEDICVPALEKSSGLSQAKGDFFVGYSPERINPGDKEHVFEKVVKVVSGQNEEICSQIAAVYELVVKAGIYKVENIKVAEAVKVLENTQRDLNIALMNELSMICQRIGIDTQSVLKAAGTKWNFLNFTPGLVGGHCIGVDPYYLTSKAEELGYHPQVVLAGRRINDSMGVYVAQQCIKEMIQAGKFIQGSNILVLGLTFKENVPDCRNSRVADIINELKNYGTDVVAHDPFVKPADLPHEFDVKLVELSDVGGMDAIILATPHDFFKKIKISELRKVCKVNHGKPVLIDVKWVFSRREAEKVGFHYWRL